MLAGEVSFYSAYIVAFTYVSLYWVLDREYNRLEGGFCPSPQLAEEHESVAHASSLGGWDRPER